MKNIRDEFDAYFRTYQREKFKGQVSYVVTSTDRKGGPTNPHAVKGNAMDITLRLNGDYAPIHEYDYFTVWMLTRWPYRMGLDRTPHETKPGKKGNVHIHTDLGMVLPVGQKMPFFFIEDNEVFIKEIKTKEDIA